MARKHSTALFDVIHSAKKPPKASPSASIPTPKWWGKDKKLPKPAVKDSAENAGRQQSWLSAAKKSAGLSASSPSLAPIEERDSGSVSAPAWNSEPAIEPFYTEQASDDVETTELNPSSEIEIPTAVEPVEPKPRFIDRFKNRPVKKEPKVEDVFIPPTIADEPVYVGGQEDPIEPQIQIQQKPERVREEREVPFHLDSKAGEVRFNLSIGGIIALGFIILMALAIAFIAGTRSGPQALLNGDSSDMSSSPTTNPTGGMLVALEPARPSDAPVVHPEVLQVLPKSSAQKVFSPPTPVVISTPLPIKSTREIGMIYVVVQSYAEQDLAQRACDFMNKAGIPCSLVQGPDGWAPRDWFSVVGLQPFAKHDPGLSEYERAVRSAGVRFTTKIMDQFQPQGYTWRETSDLSQQ